MSRKIITFVIIIIIVAVIPLTVIIAQRQQEIRQRASTTLVTPDTTPMNKKVYVLIYDPILSDGNKLSVHLRLGSADQLTTGIIDFFRNTTDGRVNYSIAIRTEINNVWLKKTDGFQYNEQTYLDVWNRVAPPHEPDLSDYYQFLNDPALDICGKFNRGEIDELWLWGTQYFGYGESALATFPNGPGIPYNGPVWNQTTCNKMMPIMGFVYDRGVAEAIEDFGHRTEATMSYLYGDWQENRMSHNWDKFGLNRAQSPNFNTAGCGSAHYTPNARTASDEYVKNITDNVNSYCDDFNNYPNLGDPQTTARAINCQAWGCTGIGYFEWWYRHMPHFTGKGSDGKLNDWWQYILDPNKTQERGSFSNFSASLLVNSATFSFSYSGASSGYKVHLSDKSDFTSGSIFWSFAGGNSSSITETTNTNPTKYASYTCGKTLYWKVMSTTGDESTVQSATIDCVSPTITSIPSALTSAPVTPINIVLACLAGDAKPCNRCIDIFDYNEWLIEFNKEIRGQTLERNADFDNDNRITIFDYTNWLIAFRANFQRTCPYP